MHPKKDLVNIKICIYPSVTAGFVKQAFTNRNVLLENKKSLKQKLQVLNKIKINMSISKIREAKLLRLYMCII